MKLGWKQHLSHQYKSRPHKRVVNCLCWEERWVSNERSWCLMRTWTVSLLFTKPFGFYRPASLKRISPITASRPRAIPHYLHQIKHCLFLTSSTNQFTEQAVKVTCTLPGSPQYVVSRHLSIRLPLHPIPLLNQQLQRERAWPPHVLLAKNTLRALKQLLH